MPLSLQSVLMDIFLDQNQIKKLVFIDSQIV